MFSLWNWQVWVVGYRNSHSGFSMRKTIGYPRKFKASRTWHRLHPCDSAVVPTPWGKAPPRELAKPHPPCGVPAPESVFQ